MEDKIRVFMVDDNEVIVSEVKKYFSSSKFNIEISKVCSNGADALEELKSNYNNYDIVIMDLVIPKMDGLSVLEELHKLNIPLKSIITKIKIIKLIIGLNFNFFLNIKFPQLSLVFYQIQFYPSLCFYHI